MRSYYILLIVLTLVLVSVSVFMAWRRFRVSRREVDEFNERRNGTDT